MGKRGVWGAEALPEDAKGPRGGDASVRVRVWEEEPETLQGMDEPRSEEDIPPDPPYGQSINVRDVQERAPTRGGHVPQERIRAEASKGGGPDDTGSKKQGAVEDGSAHIGGAEASMGERERRSGESKEPEWMGHMRRRYNVLYEAPEGIIQEVESAEDVAESWAEAGMPAVAVAIETLSDDKNNYLPDDWVHPTVHRDSLKNPSKRKQSKANSPGEKGAPSVAWECPDSARRQGSINIQYYYYLLWRVLIRAIWWWSPEPHAHAYTMHETPDVVPSIFGLCVL